MSEDNIIFSFGKYKGRLIREIFIENRSYIKWFVENTSCTLNSRAWNEAKRLLDSAINVTLKGPLTQRIKHITTLPQHVKDQLYRKLNIPSYEIIHASSFGLGMVSSILNKCHIIYPQGSGCFIDYLFRRIVAELYSLPECRDHRAELMCGFHKSFLDKLDNLTDDITPKNVLGTSDSLEPAYEKYKDLTLRTEEIIDDIFETSTSHCISFGDHEAERSQALRHEVIELITPDVIKTIRYSIQTQLLSSTILLNPSLGTENMGADADLLCGYTIIDFKMCKAIPSDNDYLQLLGYAALCSRDGVYTCNNTRDKLEIQYGVIWNPLNDIVYTYNIQDWSDVNKNSFLELLLNKDTIHNLITVK